MRGDLFKTWSIIVTINEFINKIKYLLLPLGQHNGNIFEYKSKVKGEDRGQRTTDSGPEEGSSWSSVLCPLSVVLFLALGCGSGQETAADFDATVSTQAPPFINRVNPTSGRAGDTITLFGLGFSTAAAGNIVTAGGAATSAATYALVNPPAGGEIEQLTFTIPTGVGTGAGNVFVTVFENTSNTTAFTVNP